MRGPSWRSVRCGVLIVALVATGLALSAPPPAAADGNEAPGDPAAFRSITAGQSHTCAVLAGGSVACWGSNGAGQLGLGNTAARGDGPGEMGSDLPAVDLGAGRTAIAISAGTQHTCAILDDSTLKCWGFNSSGQLGLGDTATRGDGPGEMGDDLPAVDLGTGRTATAVTASGNVTCALLDDGTVKCWGLNSSGQAGQGDTTNRGDAAGEMGDSLPAIDLGTGRTATAISAADFHICALLDNSTVKCWGSGAGGRLGLGDQTVRGDAAGEMGDSLPAIDLGTGRTATAISAGNSHTCALLDNSTVKCWGSGGSGRLGQGDTSGRGDGPGEMGDNLPAIDLGTGRTATAVTASSAHTCALLDNSTVKCWASNSSGELGLGDTSARGDGPGEMGDNLPAIDLGTGRTASAVTSGSGYTCARLDDGGLKCWGDGVAGRLGLGDTTTRGDGPGEMGDNLPAVALVAPSPAMTVVKTADETVVGVGGAVNLHITVNNTGTAALHNVTVTDANAPVCDASLGTVAVGASATVDCTDFTNAGDVPTYSNTASADSDETPPVVSNELEVPVVTAAGDPDGLRSLAAGDRHTCALLNDGNVKCWGGNNAGQLGLGDTNDRGDAGNEMGDNLPAVDLGTGRTATAISAGAFHTCALLDNGTVKCWGENSSGQLGRGNTADRGDGPGEMGDNLAAVNLGTGRTATAIVAGDAHTCALLDGDTVKCWGGNSGRLGLGNTPARGDGPGEMGNNLPTVDLGTERTATAVTAGDAHTCALLDDDTVKCWGLNSAGELGLGDTSTRGDGAGEMGDDLPAVDLGTGRTATAVIAGGAHTCALLDDGALKCWGLNSAGQLGLGDTATRGDGAGEMGDALPAVNLGTGRTATAVTAGGAHTCAVLDNGALKCWGLNSSGELGLGDTSNRGDGAGEMGDNLLAVNLGTGRTAITLAGGELHTCARLDNTTVKCWGSSSFGQLGLGGTSSRGDGANEMGDNLVTVRLLGAGRTATAVTAGTTHTCALLDDGTAKCWGSNGSGQLGQGDTVQRGDGPGEMGDDLAAVSLGAGRTATAMTASSSHTCALLDNGTVKCWGANGSGQLGLGNTTTRGDGPGEMGDNLPAVSLGTGRTATAIAAGTNHTCALLDDGSVKCWGNGFSGQLGLGDNANRGDGAGEMGDSLSAVSLGTGRTATAITASNTHTCALLDDGTVKCWGANSSGQLGLGDNANRGDGPGEMGDNLPAVSLGAGRTATAITAGTFHICVLLDDDNVKCWGGNASGQLGQGDTVQRGDAAGEMGDSLPAVSLGAGRTATAISAGSTHSCALLDDDSVKCWGNGSSGQLGLGETDPRGRGDNEMGDDLPAAALGAGRTATEITAGGNHTCAVLDNDQIKCWGNNDQGQLGLGDTASRGDGPGEMGEALLPIDLGTPTSAPGVTVVQSADESTVAVGEEVHLHLTVTNSGNAALHDVTVTTSNAPDCDGNLGTLLPDAEVTVDCTHTAIAGDIPTYSNTATVDSDETAPVVSNQVEVTVQAAAPAMTVVQTADQTDVVPGEDIDLHLEITNTGNSALTGITVDDDDAPDCEQAVPNLPVGADHIVDCTYTTGPGDGGATYTNMATVDSAQISPVDSNEIEVDVGPTLTVVEAAPADVIAGDPIPFEIEITNTSAVILKRVRVTDPFSGACTQAVPNLAVGQTLTVNCQRTTTAGQSGQLLPHITFVDTRGGGFAVSNSTATEVLGRLTGTITGPGGPAAGVFVVALDRDFLSGVPDPLKGGVVTNASGVYTIGLRPGDYHLAFIDPANVLRHEFHSNKATLDAINASDRVTLPVGSGPTTVNAALAATGAVPPVNPGTVGGTITSPTEPIPGAWALVTSLAGGGIFGGIADGNGNFSVGGLPAGPYMIQFLDPAVQHGFEYYDDALSLSGAEVVNLAAGQTFTANAELASLG